MSPDRSTLATSLKFGGPAQWDVASGRRLRTLHASPDYADQIATGVAFSPDGRFVASLAADALFVWEIASGRIVLHFPAHTSLAWSVTFSPDGSKIATSGRDGAAIWDATSGDRLARLSGVGGIADVRFSPDARLLATAGNDGKVRIWDVALGRETLSLGSTGAGLEAVAFSPDGTKLASVGLDGILRVYVLPIDELVRLARGRVTRGFTDRECRQYLHLAACTATLARLRRPDSPDSPRFPRAVVGGRATSGLGRSLPGLETAVDEGFAVLRFPLVLDLLVHGIVLPGTHVIDAVPLGHNDVDRRLIHRPPHLRPEVAGLLLGQLGHRLQVALEVLRICSLGETEPEIDEDRHVERLRRWPVDAAQTAGSPCGAGSRCRRVPRSLAFAGVASRR
jgi:WD domain, G-beta repeat